MSENWNQPAKGPPYLEITIVLLAIALIASVAGPNLLRERRKLQARRVLDELRELDAALARYADEKGAAALAHPRFPDLAKYLQTNTPLYSTGADLLGNPWGAFTIGGHPKINPATFDALSDVADEGFWSPYH